MGRNLGLLLMTLFDKLLIEIRRVTISYYSFKKKEKDKLEKTSICEKEYLENNFTENDFSLLKGKNWLLKI